MERGKWSLAARDEVTLNGRSRELARNSALALEQGSGGTVFHHPLEVKQCKEEFDETTQLVVAEGSTMLLE